MGTLWVRTISSVALVGGLVAWRIASGSLTADRQVVRVQRPLMGTVWTFEVPSCGRPAEAGRAINLAFGELARIDNLMSEWKPESPVSKIDAAAGTSAVEVPEELRQLIERSVDYSRRTRGTFDITWRGMGRIWRFDDSFVPPSPEAVAAARQRIDFRRIAVEGNRVYLPQGMSIGLGGIAKGYAIDRAAEVLLDGGFRDYLIDGGGDVRVSGSRYGDPWRIGIQSPREDRGSLLGVVRLTRGALVTSGDYERFRIVDGVRYHHIIDPRTGYPATASMSVSILAPSAEVGVVMAKAVFILGPEEGLALARAEGLEALLIDSRGNRHATGGFARKLETP